MSFKIEPTSYEITKDFGSDTVTATCHFKDGVWLLDVGFYRHAYATHVAAFSAFDEVAELLHQVHVAQAQMVRVHKALEDWENDSRLSSGDKK